MTETADFPEPRPPEGWLDQAELDAVRAAVPIVYIDAIPVQVDSAGKISAVGLLLRGGDGSHLSRALVCGRVRRAESIRAALTRLLEADLGPLAFGQLPLDLAPVTIGEYLPDATGDLFDPRQHSISLVYLIPVLGECQPTNEVLSIDWLSPSEVMSDAVAAEMVFGQATLVRRVLAGLGL